MGLLAPDGFYSVVQKLREADLCVRARDAGDLDRVRRRYLPPLIETVEPAAAITAIARG